MIFDLKNKNIIQNKFYNKTIHMNNNSFYMDNKINIDDDNSDVSSKYFAWRNSVSSGKLM